jgi:hypothetical protein
MRGGTDGIREWNKRREDGEEIPTSKRWTSLELFSKEPIWKVPAYTLPISKKSTSKKPVLLR